MIPSPLAAKNPEFIRHIWLELSPHRIIGLPLVIVLLAVMVWFLGDDPKDFSIVANVVMAIASLLILWGTHMASESLLSELRDKTWHAQRMSALSPWQLVWGKLFGSTLFAWYGVTWCLVIYLFVSPESWGIRSAIALFVVLAGLLLQSVTLLLSLRSIGRGMLAGRNQSFPYVMLMLLVLSPWLFAAVIDIHHNIEWYSMAIPKTIFINMSAALFLAWALVGLYRLMRIELQIRQGFFIWLAFELYIIVYTVSFFVDVSFLDMATTWPTRFAIAILIAISLAYAMFFLEDTTVLDVKRAVMALRAHNYKELSQLIPCWLVSFVLATVLLFCFGLFLQFTEHNNIIVFLLSIVLFALRDFSLLLWVRFRPNFKPANMVAMVIYLACSYSILPSIFYASDIHELAVLFFLPFPSQTTSMQWLIVLFEALAAYWLLQRRWRQAAHVTTDIS